MNFVRRLVRWLAGQSREQRYLCGAVHHADLENRMRAIERASCGSAFASFDH